jgi:hypothetical protein
VNNPPPGFGDFQNEIYLAGLTGRLPTLPIRAASWVDPATSTKSTVPRNRSGLGSGRVPVTNSSMASST